MHGRSRRTRAWQGHARARGHTTRMRVATNRAGILLAIMRPGVQTYSLCFHLFTWQRCSLIVRNILHDHVCDLTKKIVSRILQVP